MMRYDSLKLNGAVYAAGKGVHSGATTHVKISTFFDSYGHSFVRSNQTFEYAKGALSAHCAFVKDNTPGHTVLQRHDGMKIATVEHLLAALVGLDIDNAYVMFHGEEVPIFDGSALPWVRLFKAAGLQADTQARTFVRIRKPVRVESSNGAWCEIAPLNYDYRLRYMMHYDHPMIGAQEAEYIASAMDFEKDVAPARTFGFYSDAVHLRLQNRALGAGLDNTVVFSEDGVLNPEGLRFENEPARHKLLDAMGDLACIGAPLLGSFTGYKSGHDLNIKLVKAVVSDISNYSLEYA